MTDRMTITDKQGNPRYLLDEADRVTDLQRSHWKDCHCTTQGKVLSFHGDHLCQNCGGWIPADQEIKKENLVYGSD